MYPYFSYTGRPRLRSHVFALALAVGVGSAPVGLHAIGGYVLEPGAEGRIMLGAPAETSAALTVKNYTGREVGKALLSADGRQVVKFEPALTTGFYEVAASPGPGDATGFLVQDAVAVRDSFFAIDSAISWLTKPEQRRVLISGLQALGTGVSRERLSWNAIHPAPDRWDWDTPRQYDTTRRLYAASEVKILEMFHDAPKWLGAAQGGRFPDDLIGASASWREIASRWHDTWQAVEVWNEPDIVFGGNQPADQYAPIVKTIRHTMRAAGYDLPIVGGVIAYLNRDYLETAARNGLLGESDAISFHYYGDPLGMEKHVAELREWLRGHQAEGKPLWLTECGNNWMGSAKTRPTATEQAVTALAFGMNAVEAKACGIAAFYPFVYVRYNEGPKNFGMSDAAGAPLRAMAAYAQALRALSGADYLGDIPATAIASAKRVRVFAQGGAEALVVVYTGEVSQAAALRLPFAVKDARGIDGRHLEPAGEGEIPCADGLVYLRVDRAAIGNLLKQDTEAARLNRAGRQAPVMPQFSSLVLQPVLDMSKVTASSRGYYLPEKLESLDLELRVNNLGETPAKVVLRPDGGRALEVEVPGRSRAKQAIRINVASLTADANGTTYYTVKAEAGDGGRVSSVVLPFILSQGVQAHLQKAAYQFNLPIAELHRWQHNNAPGKARFLPRRADAAWGLKIDFEQEAERWAYPRFSLPQEVDLDRVQGALVRARAKQGQVRLMTWSGNAGPRYTSFPIIPADGEWHVAYIPFSSFMEDGAGKPIAHALRQVSVGLNSKDASALLEVSDLYLLGK